MAPPKRDAIFAFVLCTKVRKLAVLVFGRVVKIVLSYKLTEITLSNFKRRLFANFGNNHNAKKSQSLEPLSGQNTSIIFCRGLIFWYKKVTVLC